MQLSGGMARSFSPVDAMKHLVMMLSALSPACGSGSASNGPPQNMFETYSNSAMALIVQRSPITYTDLEIGVPTVGTNAYSGYLLAQFANADDAITDSIAGQMEMQVAFDATEMVTGRAFDIYDTQGQPLTGQIDLAGGYLDRDGDPLSDATFIFTGLGTLTDTNNAVMLLDLQFEGDFLDQGATGVGGDILGTLTSDVTDQTAGGLFILELSAP